MALVRGFSKVDDQGRIPIPNHVQNAVKLRPGQRVEIKVTGPNKAEYLVIHKREQIR